MHARFRKSMDSGFTEKAVRLQEPILQKHVALFIDQLEKLSLTEKNGAVIDIVPWFSFVGFDLVGDLGFGEPFGCLQNSELHPWISMIFASLGAATLRVSLKFYPSLSWLFGLTVPKSVVQKQTQHWQLSVEKMNRRLNQEEDRPDLVSMIKRDEDGIRGITLAELHATASVLIVAGSETTVSVLSGITNYLVKNPEKLNTLTREVRSSFGHEADMSIAALKDLPYLAAVIQEGLRLCNPT
jgi:cytochrome P450